MSLLNRARQELLRMRLSAQEALQPRPSRGQVEQVVRELTGQEQQRRKGTQGQGEYRYDEPSQGGWDHYQEDQQRQRQSQQGQGVFPQQQGIIGGLLGGLGGGRFPIRDALASYIKSRAGPQPPQEGEGTEYYEKRRSKKISLAD